MDSTAAQLGRRTFVVTSLATGFALAVRPVGAQSVPLGDYLDLADLMLYDDQRAGRQRDGSVWYVARRLAAMHRAQAATLRAAQRNRRDKHRERKQRRSPLFDGGHHGPHYNEGGGDGLSSSFSSRHSLN